MVRRLETLGFREPTYSGDEIAVLDEQHGLLAPCPWLDIEGDRAKGWRISLRDPQADQGPLTYEDLRADAKDVEALPSA